MMFVDLDIYCCSQLLTSAVNGTSKIQGQVISLCLVIFLLLPTVAKLGFPHSRLYAFSSNSDNIVYHPP